MENLTEKTSFLTAHIEKFLNYLRVIKEASVHTLRSYSIDLSSLDDFLKKEKEIEKSIDRDTWMSAEEAKSFGLLKRIISSYKDI